MENKSKEKFVAGLAIFSIVLALITIGALYFTFKAIDNDAKEKIEKYEQEKKLMQESEVAKREADDKQYTLNSYSETYNENAIEIKKVEDGDIKYFEISGLKSKEIEKDINNRIKNEAYSFKMPYVNSYVQATFSNILSIELHGANDANSIGMIKTINVNLATGEDILLEDVFVSSATINMYLANALYEKLAWQMNQDPNYSEGYGLGQSDMNNRDTSEYEDKFLILARRYNEQKGTIKFSISPEGVEIFDIADDILNGKNYEASLKIRFEDYLEEVAIYKKYLTEESIFENPDIGDKGVIVCTDNWMYRDKDYMVRTLIGKIRDNIFVEEVIEGTGISNKVVKEFTDKLSSSTKSNLVSQIKSTQGAILQLDYYTNDWSEQGFVYIGVTTSLATCTREYFANDAFKDYISFANRSTGEATMRMITDSTEGLKVDIGSSEYYLDLKGNIIARSVEEIEAWKANNNVNQ